jgi:hypothetical protein
VQKLGIADEPKKADPVSEPDRLGSLQERPAQLPVPRDHKANNRVLVGDQREGLQQQVDAGTRHQPPRCEHDLVAV